MQNLACHFWPPARLTSAVQMHGTSIDLLTHQSCQGQCWAVEGMGTQGWLCWSWSR